MQRFSFKTGFFLILFLSGCSTTTITTDQKSWKPIYRIQVGSNKGGVVENTDLSVIPNTEVDAYSGATSNGINASGKVILPLRKNSIETGVEFMYNHQIFTYKDAVNGFSGERKLGVSQFMIPVTYSFNLFRKKHPEGLFQIKIGYAAQLNLFAISNGNGTLPNYTTQFFSNGATIGFSTTPVRLRNGSKLGFYIDGYRGTQAYEDFYNRTEFEMPGTAFIKYGIIYQF